jgi:hypothetical protein
MNGFIDPTVKGDTVRERAILAAARERGLSIHRCHAKGTAIRLSGPGVNVLASGLGALSLVDLQPAVGFSSRR